MIDHQKLNQNFQYFDKETIIEIIDIFFSEYPERVEKITKNIQEGDFIQLKFNTHSLKGVVANFQDPLTIELSRKFDEMAKNHLSSGLSQVFEELKSASEKLLEELNALKTELAAK
ncbi:MAG: Hpt domain-containing protein [Bacteroidetes bacterium]|nr:Hpt domain-containing protein [Bacteroidota bacterium]